MCRVSNILGSGPFVGFSVQDFIEFLNGRLPGFVEMAPEKCFCENESIVDGSRISHPFVPGFLQGDQALFLVLVIDAV